MALTPVFNLETTTDVHEDHDILVYQGGELRKLNSKDFLYTKDYIESHINKYRKDIIASLVNMCVDVKDTSSLNDCAMAIDAMDVLEIGVRRLVHNGTNTETLYNASENNEYHNENYNNTGIPQSDPALDRVYKIGDTMTIIPKISIADRDPNTDFIFADWSDANGIKRNDFIGGKYSTTDKWKNGIYPWNSMRKVKIIEKPTGETVFDYNNENSNTKGNWFTEVPLYFIRNAIITEDGIDITDSWPIIPAKYQNKLIYEYKFVCKSMLPGYRPAEFFKSYETKVRMDESNEGEYIYLNSLNCYYKYSSADILEHLDFGVKKYKKVKDNTVKTYVTILDKKHYFSCYEMSKEDITNSNGATVTGAVSRPNKFSITCGKYNGSIIDSHTPFRDWAKNLSSKYYLHDMRSHNDFFITLMEIEFATTNSEFSVKTPKSLSLSLTPIEAVTNSNSVKVKKGYVHIGDTISVGTKLYDRSIAMDRLVDGIESIDDTTDLIYFDGEAIDIPSTARISLSRYISGYTDDDYKVYYRDPNGNISISGSDVKYSTKNPCNGLSFRTGAANGIVENSPIKWNWIENPWGNTRKIIDGLRTVCAKSTNGLMETAYYITNNPDLYQKGIEGDSYRKIKYILSTFSGSNLNCGPIMQYGIDNIYPWAKLVSKLDESYVSHDKYYCEYCFGPDEAGNYFMTYGASYYEGTDHGIYSNSFSKDRYITSTYSISTHFERKE